jgi:hypothetical protein
MEEMELPITDATNRVVIMALFGFVDDPIVR